MTIVSFPAYYPPGVPSEPCTHTGAGLLILIRGPSQSLLFIWLTFCLWTILQHTYNKHLNGLLESSKKATIFGHFLPNFALCTHFCVKMIFLCFLRAIVSGWSSMHATGGSSPPVIRLWSLGHSLSLMIIYAVTPWIQCYILLLIFSVCSVVWTRV